MKRLRTRCKLDEFDSTRARRNAWISSYPWMETLELVWLRDFSEGFARKSEGVAYGALINADESKDVRPDFC